MQHMSGVLDRNKMGVLVLMMTELTFFWNRVEVILVDYSVPRNTPIGNEILPYVGEIPHAQATAPTSGKKLTCGGTPVQMKEHLTESLQS